MSIGNGKRPVVFLALPNRPGEAFAAGILSPLFHTGTRHQVYDIRAQSASLLPLNFNNLWCQALNERPAMTHFCMMHSDVCPEDGWLDILLDEQRKSGADILSVVIPIKDERGLTSTGVMDWRTRQMRHLTVREALKLPPTFDAAEAGYPGQCLLMNTGLWVCDFTRPWVEQMYFRFEDRIVRRPDGRFEAQAVSEDWLFSIDAARMGLKVFATTAVKVKHQGNFQFPNFAPWGSLETDDSPGQAFGISDVPLGVSA